MVLTRCTRSKEKMWILQVTVDRVQMMVERMLRPHALNNRSCKEIYIQVNQRPTTNRQFAEIYRNPGLN